MDNKVVTPKEDGFQYRSGESKTTAYPILGKNNQKKKPSYCIICNPAQHKCIPYFDIFYMEVHMNLRLNIQAP